MGAIWRNDPEDLLGILDIALSRYTLTKTWRSLSESPEIGFNGLI